MSASQQQGTSRTAVTPEVDRLSRSASVWSDLLWAAPAYLLLALIFTFPLVLNFTDYIPGDLESDVWKHIWGMWWTKKELVDNCVLPLHTHLLNAPYGGALFFIDPLNGLLSVPWQFFFSMPVVYNIMLLFNIMLAALGAFCLSRHLCGNSLAAFFAGSVYGFSAYFCAYITSGVTEAVNIGWIPFYALFFIRMLGLGRRSDVVWAGVFFGLATLGSWYYGAFCVLFSVFYYIWFVLRRYRRPLAELGRQCRDLWRGCSLKSLAGRCVRALTVKYRTAAFYVLLAGVSFYAWYGQLLQLRTDGETLKICLCALALLASCVLIYARLAGVGPADEVPEEEGADGPAETLLPVAARFPACRRYFAVLGRSRWLVLLVLVLSWFFGRLFLADMPLLSFLGLWLSLLALLQPILVILSALYGTLRRAVYVNGRRDLLLLFEDFWSRCLKHPCAMVALGVVIIAGPAIEFRRTINSEESLVFRRREEVNVDIHLSRRFMNVCRLIDFGRIGKTNATRSYTVDKLTRVAYIGWINLAVVGLGLLAGRRRRQTGFWLFMALVFVMFSLGPFCYVTDDIYLKHKSFIYMAFFRYFPLFSQVSIPFRFCTLVMMSVGILASFSLTWFFRGLPRRRQAVITAGLVLASFFEVVLLSPAPYPIPLSSTKMPAYCTDLARDGRDCCLVDIPIQRYKGELLPGEYFYFQMEHGKNIPNRVEGTIPLFVFQNPFANYLFVLEHAQEDIPPRKAELLEYGLEEMSRFGFRYIVVHDALLRNAARARIHTLMEHYLGAPQAYPDGVKVYAVPAGMSFEKTRELREKLRKKMEESSQGDSFRGMSGSNIIQRGRLLLEDDVVRK